MRRRSIPLILTLFVVVSGCTSSPKPVSASELPPGVTMGPEGAAFYTAPPVPAGARPGDLVWARPLTSPAPGLAGVAILYWSTAASGRLVAVSGVLVQRAGERPDPTRTIVAWAHGTVGLGDQCAPSQGYFQGIGESVLVAQFLVDAGGIFVASDYEGLGPPGDHPYLVSQASGRNVLDSIRAAARFNAAGASAAPMPPAVILGVSQGGVATLFAAEMHSAYAPELRVLGAVAVSTGSNLDTLASSFSGGSYFGFVLMMIHGFEAAYPELTPQLRKLTPEGRMALDRIPAECADQILSEYAGRPESQYGAGLVFHSADFGPLLAANDPGRSVSDVPILLVHGETDDIVPVQYNRDLLRRYCATGTTVSQSIYPGRGHINVLSAALPEVVSYWKARLADIPASPDCVPATP